MARLSIVTRPSKRQGDSSRPIALRISHQGTTRYIFLGPRIKKTYWNDNRGEVRRSHPKSREVNRYLQEVRSVAENVLTDLQASAGRITAGRLKERINAALDGEEETDSFISFCRDQLSQYRSRGQERTAQAYRTAVNKLETFAGDLTFGDLTVSLLEEWSTWMAEERGNAVTTRSNDLSRIRTMWRRAQKAGRAPSDRNPFDHIRLQWDRAEKQPLTASQFERFEQADVEARSYLWHVQQLFRFQVYGMGIRLGDAVQLRWENVDGRLTYTMDKNGKAVDVKLVPGARDVLDRYDYRRDKEHVFPFLDEYETYSAGRSTIAVDVNRALKELADRAGIGVHLTSHVARNTFALLAVEGGWTVRQVQEALKHSSIATTEKYLEDVTSGELDDQMDELF